MARRKVTAKPRWIEKQQRWRIDVQRDGVRKCFYSNTPGRSGKFECIEQAEEWLNASDSLEPACDPLVREAYAEWLEKCTSRVGTDEYRTREKYGRLYILPKIGNLRVSQVREQKLQDIIDYSFRHPANSDKQFLARKTLQNLRGVLITFVTYCRRSGLTDLRPEELTIPRSASKGTKRILQPQDLRVLFASDETTNHGGGVHAEWYIHLFRFMTLTSLRPGEVIGLQWNDLHGNMVSLRRAINLHGETTSGKNQNALRSFDLPSLAAETLKDQRIMLQSAGVTSQYVFPGPDGDAAREKTVLRHLHAYCRHNQITDVTLYELRHTWFSVNKSLPAEYVKAIGGHSKVMDTFGVYGHEVDGEKAEAAKMVDERMRKLLDRTFDRT